MSETIDECYGRPHLGVQDGIPVFSASDAYVENYDRISADHIKHFEATGHNPFMREGYWQGLEASTEALVRRYATGVGTRILDVGVGMGRLLGRLPEFRRYGVDISLGYLRFAREKGIEVCMSRIEDMPYRQGYFDVVVATDVLEHVLDINLAITRILQVVKDGGVMIVRVPYREDLGPYLQPGYPYELVHLRSFDEHGLRILFEKIFHRQVVEWGFVGHECGRVRHGAGFRYYAAAMHRMIDALGWISTALHRRVCRALRSPTEINIVIRNAASAVTDG
jgi:SAM-dependent methyltransferase